MIEINYYDKYGNQLARDVMTTDKLQTELLVLTCKKCTLLGYYSYTAKDSNGNRIEEIVLKDETNSCVEQTTKANSKSRCKPIAQYTEDGEFIQVWPSAREVAHKLDVGWSTIGNAARESRKAHGFVWKYIKEEQQNG